MKAPLVTEEQRAALLENGHRTSVRRGWAAGRRR